MMRRNNKKRNGFVFPSFFAVVVLFLAALALCYVWLGCRCEALGGEIKLIEDEHADLNKKCSYETCRWSRMRALPNVKATLGKHGIVMTWPSHEQVVRLGRSGESYDGLAGVVGARASDDGWKGL